jgi:hypothetical protein
LPFWFSALIAVAGAFALAYAWASWPATRWPRSRLTGVAAETLTPLKTIIEIGAILVAGLWTYEHFLRVDAPSLRTNLAVGAELKREAALDGDRCLMGVYTRVENIGKAEVSIERVVQTVWRVPDNRLWMGTGPSRFVNVESMLKQKDEFPPLDSVEFKSGDSLAYHYAPGASAEFTFTWLLPEMPLSDTVLVRFDFDVNGMPGLDFKFVWGKPCSPPVANQGQAIPVSAAASTTN